ncbi:unnamed protein product, partial [Symbiodinium microadriaticum]
AIVTLEVESFTLPSVMTMLDFTPASFADTGEVEAIKAVINSQGMDKLGKAERYLHELAKVRCIASDCTRAFIFPVFAVVPS